MHLILMHSKCIRVSIGNAFDDNFISRLNFEVEPVCQTPKSRWSILNLIDCEMTESWTKYYFVKNLRNDLYMYNIRDEILRRFCMCSTWLGLCVSSWFWCYYMTLWFCICLLDDKFSLVNPQVGNREPSRFFFPVWLTKCIVHSLEILIHVSSIYVNNVFMVGL